MHDSESHPSFSAAARRVLGFLNGRIGVDLWMVCRVACDDCTVLEVLDHGYNINHGASLPWSETLCFQMVSGHGPRIAPATNKVAAYATAPMTRRMRVGAYVGVPLLLEDGTLYGTLCGIHPTELPEAIAGELPLVELLAELLSDLLAVELRANDQARRAQNAENEALTDALSGLYNRRGWDRLLVAEEIRCQRFGHPASVISIDLDGLKAINDEQGHSAGDALIRRAADSLQATIRASDVLARVGGDEFTVLAVETDRSAGEALARRIGDRLQAAHVRASLGLGARESAGNIELAWHEADQVMYADKRRRKSLG